VSTDRARCAWRAREGGRGLPLLLCCLCSAFLAFAPIANRAGAQAAPEPDAPAYRLVAGQVDAQTYEGYRRYNAVCSHCHGLDGAGGSFGPSLIASHVPAAEFRSSVLDGRGQGSFVMKGYAGDPNVEPYVDAIYAYLRGRADGAIGRGRPLRVEPR
jgi:mono/diheme cytochrome c family protein